MSRSDPGPSPHSYEPPRAPVRAALPRVYVTPVVIALNVLAFIAVGVSGGGWTNPDTDVMVKFGADVWQLTTAGDWWRLLTSAFLHFGIVHLLANMYALGSVGPLCERLFGSVFFGLLYLFSAVLSGLASVWWDRFAVSAGASGAVFAVFGALIAYVAIHRASFPRGAARGVLQSALVMVAFNVVYGLNTQGISNSAHLGGLASGLVLGALMARPLEFNRRRGQTKLRLALGVGVGLLALIVGVVLIPKSGGVNLNAEQAFAIVRHSLAEDEERVAKRVEQLGNQRERGSLTDEQLAAKLESDVVPAWDAMHKKVVAAAVPPKSSSRPFWQLLVNYTKLRRDQYSLTAKVLRTGDAELQKGIEQIQQQVELITRQMKRAAEKAYPG